jgi:hypothetical protein
MMKFYSIRHNNNYKRGMPETGRIVAGMVIQGRCGTCGVLKRSPSGDLKVELGKTRAKMWPDIVACGDYPCFVVSERFMEAMRACGVRLELGGEVGFVEPILNGLSLRDAPQYYWIDGKRHFAATMDFEASGYINVRFCPECGTRSENISATHRRQRSSPPPGEVFDYDASSGHDLFTTDLSPTAFFCTDAVIECARRHRLTNLRFIPVEASAATWSDGIDYLGKTWPPPRHPLRCSEGKALAEWIELLRNPDVQWEARCAVLDLGDEAFSAIPTLTKMLDDSDDRVRYEAALLLSQLRKRGARLEAKADAAATEHERQFQTTLGRPS